MILAKRYGLRERALGSGRRALRAVQRTDTHERVDLDGHELRKGAGSR